MHASINPASIAPANNDTYSHAVLIAPGMRILHISGQIGSRADGTIPVTFAEQAEIVWSNLRTILQAADMDVSHLVKINSFIVGTTHLPAFVASRHRFLGDLRPASTAICVAQLLRPEWMIEVDAVAAA